MSYAGKININSTDYPIASTLYKECETAADQTPKVVSFAEFDTLLPGVMIAVKFTNSNTATNPQLQVGTTQAKIVYSDGINPIGNTPSTSWPANSVVLFLYDGSVWRVINTSKALRAEMLTSDSNLQSQINTITDTTIPGINTAVADKEPKMLRFANKSATFTSGSGITNFSCRAEVACEGVTASMIPYVVFSGNDAGSGDYAPYCQSYDGGVYLYSTKAETISGITIICWRP